MLPNDSSSGQARQVSLSFMKSFEIAVKNIRARLLRSSITIMSLVLAIAFLSFVFIGNDLANGLSGPGGPRIQQKSASDGCGHSKSDAMAGNRAKNRWLVFLSLLVCVVGIVNAQLMAVTERFQEIGTMKCLGALDSFILRIFILEAALQGLLGSGLGALAGGVFAFLNAALHSGMAVFYHCSCKDVCFSFLFAVVIGCLLSILGVLYPALLAAGMQPTEAMRVEQ